MIKWTKLIILNLWAFVFTSCAPGGEGSPDNVYGFLGGLWHGFILLFSFIGNLVSSWLDPLNTSKGIFANQNTGLWYWIGCALGITIFILLVLIIRNSIRSEYHKRVDPWEKGLGYLGSIIGGKL